jgi:hypothetical protein
VICNGNISTLSVSGANTFTWNATTTGSTYTVNPTTLTVYTVSGTNSFTCDAVATITIDVFSPTVGITGNTVICEGNSATLTATSADTYTWSNNFQSATNIVTPGSTTTYTVDALTTSAGGSGITCPSSATVQVKVNAMPSVTATSNYTALCKGESATITATGANTYSWSTSATTNTISVTATVVSNILVTVVGTSTDNCSGNATIQLKVNACTGLEENAKAASLSVFPNPNNGRFTVRSEEALELNVINGLGQVVKALSLNGSNNYEVSVSELPAGVYFITGKSGHQQLSKKIVIKD